jgi:predicted MPP superfamily phosphohydrolase
MSFLDTIQNVWLEEEVELLEKYFNLKLTDIHKQFLLKGFDRSIKAIAKKRSKLRKKEADTAQVAGKETTIIIDDPITIVTKPAQVKKITTLVVPDAHVSPKQDISRFACLGKLANERKPDNIIFMGDFLNMDSLSSWDAGKEASHGKRYKEDIKSGYEALQLFLKQLTYKPNLVFLSGNHDSQRIEKYIESHPMLRGHMDLQEDLRLKELGFTYVPYKKFYEVEGTLFTHAIMSAANTPVSSKNIMPLISSLVAKSVVVGHHHRLESANFFRFHADDIQQVLISGIFSESTEKYAEDAANAYWRGCCILTHWKYGRFDTEQISIERLKALYS